VKICVFGAGAIGGYIAVSLAQSDDVEVSCIARGPHLKAMRERGLTLRSGGEETVARIAATDDPVELGPQDYVIVGLKAPSAAAAADKMAPLLGPDTAVVTAQNGIPWWYFYKHGGDLDGTRLNSVDPGDRQWDLIGPRRALGGVVYPSAEIVEPGVIAHSYGNRIMLGEPDGSKSERATRLSKAMVAGGIKAPVRPRIRDDIWTKLWGNISFNPVSVLTHATLDTLATDPDTLRVIRPMMVEAQAVGEALGIGFPVDVDKRIDWAREVGAHKTSTLQDLELGRAMELDALVTVVTEMARLVGVATPTIDMVLGLVRRRAIEAGCYPAP